MIFTLLSLVYKSITSTRNILFDKGFFKEYSTEIKSIGVGNLTVGGTGKTPMVNYLISIFSKQNIGVISRGYGRKTKGFIEIDSKSTPQEVGDEPYMLSRNNPNTVFFVSEKRVLGYQKATELYPDLNLFIFDDVYQHRHIMPTINILLCDYNNPFYSDFLMPKGRLRETRKGANRADLVVVTKCPKNLSSSDKNEIESKIKQYTNFTSNVFFAEYIPSIPENISRQKLEIRQNVVLVSALANNSIFKTQQAKNFNILAHFEFKDHHSFTRKDIDEIHSKYPNIPIITTEKDMVKIALLLDKIEIYNYFIPVIEVKIINDFRNTLIERLALDKKM